jgi:hypothetical protein
LEKIKNISSGKNAMKIRSYYFTQTAANQRFKERFKGTQSIAQGMLNGKTTIK